VRKTIRRTMIEVNPDTILLGESTNDAAPDFQGDAWHGAMTYTPFTRPLWSWLLEPGSAAGGGIGFALDAVPSYDAHDFVAAHERFAAGFPWRTRLATMNALDTHDTPRFTTNARPGTVPVALGLAVTMPGIPVVWAGDEFGLTGVDGEASRTPIPWGSEDSDQVAPVLETYRTLLALRREHPVLGTGGLRFLAVGADAVAFVRESAAEQLLVFAARGATALELPEAALVGADAAAPVWGDARLEASDGLVQLSTAGPAFAVWRLDGVAAPPWSTSPA
jgi:alpha-glucosidase